MLSLGGAVLSCVLVGCGGSATPASPGQESSPPVAATSSPELIAEDSATVPSASVGAPESLVIAKIDVRAPVFALGLTAEGAQEVPSSVLDVGWWKHGSEPAEAGNAVLVGHANSRGDGVFDDLHTLQAGDLITVAGSVGEADFVVERTATVPVQDFEKFANDIYRTEGKPRLVVMTCGDFDGSDYQSTVIVWAGLTTARS